MDSQIFDKGNELIFTILTSLGYDAGKAYFHKKIVQPRDHPYIKAVNDTIAFCKGRDIELTNAHFNSWYDSDAMQSEIAKFHLGQADISITILAEEFSKLDFDCSDKESASIEIVEFFLKQLYHYILSNPHHASELIYASLSVQKNKYNELHEMFDERSKATLDILERIEGKLAPDKLSEISQNSLPSISTSKGQTTVLAEVKPEDDPVLLTANRQYELGNVINARELYLELLNRTQLKNKELRWKLNSNIGKTYLNSRNVESGIQYFEEAYGLFSSEPKGMLQLMFARFIHGPEQAVEIGYRILAVDPENKTCLSLLEHALVKCNRGDEALIVRKEDSLTSHEDFYSRAWILHNIDRFHDAEEYYKKALAIKRTPELLSSYASCILEQLITDYKNYGSVMEGIAFRLNECEELLTEAIAAYEQTQEFTLLGACLSNRAIIYNLQGKHGESINSFQAAEKNGINDAKLYGNWGVTLLVTGDYSNATSVLQRAYNLDQEYAEKYCSSLILEGRIEEAKKILSEVISYPTINITEINYKLYLILAEILDLEAEHEDADKLISAIESAISPRYSILHLQAEVMWNRGYQSEAIELLESRISKITSQQEIVQLQLADFYIKSEKWHQAIKIYREFTNPKYSHLLTQRICFERIIFCFYKVGNYRAAIYYCSLLEQKDELGSNVKEVLAIMYSEMEEIEKARLLFKELAQATKSSKHFLNWALSEYHSGNRSKAKNVLNKVAQDFAHEVDVIIALSQIYFSTGEYQKAIDTAYEVALKNPSNPSINLNFLHICFQLGRTENGDSFVNGIHKNLNSQLLNNWTEMFPGNTAIQRFNVNIETFEEMKAELRRINESRENIVSFHNRHKSPISLTSQVLRSSVSDTLENLANHPQARIWAYTPEQFSYELLRLDKDYEYVVEPVAFFGLLRLKKLSLLDQVLGNYKIPYRIYAELQSKLEDLRLDPGKEKLGVALVNEELTRIVTPPELVQSEISYYEEVLLSIKDKLIGFQDSPARILHNKIEGAMHPGTLQAIDYADRIRNCVLVSDDRATLFSKRRRTRTVSTYAILKYSVTKNIISEYEFNEAIVVLAGYGYEWLPVSTRMILQVLCEIDFEKSWVIERALNYCATSSQVEPKSIEVVAAELLYNIYKRTDDKDKRCYWASVIINAAKTNNKISLPRILIRVADLCSSGDLMRADILGEIMSSISQIMGLPIE